MLPGLEMPKLDLGLGALGKLLPGGGQGRTRSPPAYLCDHIEYVLAYDEAVAELATGGGLDALIEEGGDGEGVTLIRESKLAEAIHLYARRIRNKGELGVLATMNAKAWADLRNRTGLDDAALASLEAPPDDLEVEPALLVLPDRIIVVGLAPEELTAVLKARRLGEKDFIEHPLAVLGRTTFALTFPDEIVLAGNFEYGVEVKVDGRTRLTWPPKFPARTQTAAGPAPAAPRPAPLPEPMAPRPVAAKYTIVPEWGTVQIAWDARPGEQYSVFRDGVELGSVRDGWFEDASPTSDTMMHYRIVARNLASGKTAECDVTIPIPELPLPEPPDEIRVTTRGNRIVLGWDSASPQAAQYYVLKYNEQHEIIEETYVDADYGHYLQISDQVSGGTPYTYTLAAVAPDGRIGAPSKRIGVISSTEPMKPLVHLSFEDESFLEGLVQLADNALALGGRGWAELTPQPEWNPDHALTLALWANLDDLEGMPVLICKGAWQEAGYFLQIFQKQVRYYMAGVDALDAGRPRAGVWQHIAATYGFGNMRIYINGEQVGRKRVTGRPRPSERPLLIGRYIDEEDVYFMRGLMDDIRIYNVPLTAGEVKDLYEETRRE